MKIERVLGKNILVEWYDFNAEKIVGGIIIAEKAIRSVRENRGIVKMVGNDVKEVKVGDYVMYAMGTLYLPFKVNDDEKVIIIPEDDVLMILEEECEYLTEAIGKPINNLEEALEIAEGYKNVKVKS